jgi:microcystin-dependent protein
MTSTLRTNAALTARNKPLTGDTKTSFVNDDHMGWLRCDGRSLDKTTYNLLFQVIGYTFGGSGANFNLPDPRGRVMGSVGPVTDVNGHTASYVPGHSVGELDHQLTVGEMPAHNHSNATPAPGVNSTAAGSTSSYTHNHGGSTGEAGSAAESETVSNVLGSAVVAGSGTHSHSIASDTHSHTINSNGGDQYHNNVQPTLFYGNTFIYSGIPISTHGVSAGIFPYTVERNPVLI